MRFKQKGPPELSDGLSDRESLSTAAAMFETALITEAFERVCQDRVAIVSSPERCVLVVADGAGGTGGEGRAASAVVEEVRRAMVHAHSSENWVAVLRQIDGRIGPGESTAVVVDVRRDRVFGASVGDSQAWLVNGPDLANLTAGQHRKPLLGSGEARPVGFSHGPLEGVLIVASDGFCNYVKCAEMLKVIPYEDVALLPKRLVSLVRLRSGALNDDIGIAVCRRSRRMRPAQRYAI